MSAGYISSQRGEQNPNYRHGIAANRAEYARRWSKAWRAANPQKVKARNRNARAQRKGAEGAHAPRDIRRMLQRQDRECAACGLSLRDGFHVDHVIPVVRGGSNSAGNLQLLCPSCNTSKGKLLWIEFRLVRSLVKNQVEHREQVALISWARRLEGRMPELAMLFAVPNGGDRDVRVGFRLKQAGVSRGVPDLVLPIARQGFHGLFIEMKAPGGRVSPEQAGWIERLRAAGHRVEVCYGWDRAAEVITEYLRGN